MFPVGLYGTLLAALFGVTFPAALAPVEAAARTIVCLPLRAYSMSGVANPVVAAATPTPASDVFADLGKSVLAGGRGPAGYLPQVCRVRDKRAGPSGIVDELELDVTVSELQSAAALVTVGRALVGHLVLSGGADARARVQLLAYRPRRGSAGFDLRVGDPAAPRRVAAQVPCREIDAQGTLHFLVEPSRSIDPWPLRCSLLDDSYLASRLRRSGGLVTTSDQSGDSDLPKGLAIGRLMIWGYPRRGIPVGLFVDPAVDGRAIHSVTVWRRAGAGRRPALRPEQVGSFLPVRLTRYPAPRPSRVRWMVTSTAGATLPDGAALVDRGRFLGCLRAPWSGQSLVTPFSVSTRTWALVVRSAGGAVFDAVGRIVGTEADGRLRIELESPASVEAGALFTGNNGLHCPAGLYIGAVTPGLGPEMRVAVAEGPALRPEVFLLDAKPRKTERKR